MTYGRSRRTHRDAAACALVAAALLSVNAAHAQTGTPTAAEVREGHTLFSQGYAAFQALDYASALSLFQRAFVLTRDPAMLYNIGTTLGHLSRNAEAATALRRYLAAVPNAANRVETEARIAQFEAPVAIASPPPSEASVAPTVSSSPPPAAVVEAPASRPVWPWLFLGGGVLVGAVGGATAALVGDPGSPPDRYSTEREYLRAVDAGNVQHSVGGVVAGVGVAAIVIGVIGVATYQPHPARPRISWDVSPTREGAMFHLGVLGVDL